MEAVCFVLLLIKCWLHCVCVRALPHVRAGCTWSARVRACACACRALLYFFS